MFLKSGLGWIRIQKKQSRNTWNTGTVICGAWIQRFLVAAPELKFLGRLRLLVFDWFETIFVNILNIVSYDVSYDVVHIYLYNFYFLPVLQSRSRL